MWQLRLDVNFRFKSFDLHCVINANIECDSIEQLLFESLQKILIREVESKGTTLDALAFKQSVPEVLNQRLLVFETPLNSIDLSWKMARIWNQTFYFLAYIEACINIQRSFIGHGKLVIHCWFHVFKPKQLFRQKVPKLKKKCQIT